MKYIILKTSKRNDKILFSCVNGSKSVNVCKLSMSRRAVPTVVAGQTLWLVVKFIHLFMLTHFTPNLLILLLKLSLRCLQC